MFFILFFVKKEPGFNGQLATVPSQIRNLKARMVRTKITDPLQTLMYYNSSLEQDTGDILS